MAIIGMAKFYYYSCIGNRGFIFINPSGHMGLAIIAYSPIYLIQKNISNLYINLLSTFIMVLILFLIGFSRYILHYHTINEIILGAMIGALVSLKVISSEIDIQPNFWFNKNVMLFLLCLAFITYFWVDFSSERLVQYVARKSDIIFQCF